MNLYTLQDLSKISGHHITTIREKIKYGTIEYTKTVGDIPKVLFTEPQVQKYLKKYGLPPLDNPSKKRYK